MKIIVLYKNNYAKIYRYKYTLKLCCNISVELFLKNIYGHRVLYKTW